MADPIRDALELLLSVVKPKYTDPDEIVALALAVVAARAALAAQPPAPAPTIDDIWRLCEDHDFQIGDGASADESAEILLEVICAALARWGAQPPAAAAVRAELLPTRYLHPSGGVIEVLRPSGGVIKVLRQPAPAAVPAELLPTRYLHPSGATIERTRTEPEAWAVRRGSERMSTWGQWSIEPSPSERGADYLTEHSFASPHAALEVLQHHQPPQGGEVQ
jgi:hypothetical protein